MPRALVTGATGLIGSHIADHLLASGWSVRALLRRASPELVSRGVEPAFGDVLDAASFASAASECDVVFHAAAAITARGGWESYRRPNVDGTTNAIVAAERSGARLVHVSSVAVYAGRYDDPSRKIDEGSLLDRALPEHAFYARSKRESEALVLGAHAQGRIWATAVRPCVVYGERDRQFIPRIARVLRYGVAPAIGGGRTTLPIVGAGNVAQGAVLAASGDLAGGRAYNLTNDYDVTLRDLYRHAAEGLGRRMHVVPVPLAPAEALLRAWMRLARRLRGGGSSGVSRAALAMVTRDNPFSSDRARRELGWTPPVPPERGLVDAFRWWRIHG